MSNNYRVHLKIPTMLFDISKYKKFSNEHNEFPLAHHRRKTTTP